MSLLDSTLNLLYSTAKSIPLPSLPPARHHTGLKPASSPVTVAATAMPGPLIRIAGLSGAAAVILGAYGSHVLRDSEGIDERRTRAFETGSRYHLLHSVALLGTHHARYPWVTAGLLVAGITLFCGPCYHYSITGDEKFRRFTPTGGILFILGWLSFIL